MRVTKGLGAILSALLICFLVRAATAQTFTEYTLNTMLGSQVKLSYKVKNNAAYFLVEKTAAGHVAFGIGASMASADIVVIEKSSTDPTKLTLKDCKLKGTTTPICNEASEDWKWVAADSYSSSGTMMKAEIFRPLAASTAAADEDKEIINGENSIIYSYTTSNSLVVHDATGANGAKKVNLAGQTAANRAGLGTLASLLLASIVLGVSI